MKILYACHRFPFPPKRGGKIRPFNMIRHLHESGHEVTVAAPVRDESELAEGRGLAAHCTEILTARISGSVAALQMIAAIPTPTPSSFGYFRSRRLQRQARDAAQRARFDLVFVHCSSAVPNVAGISGVPRIVDFGDMDSQKWLDYATQRPWPMSWVYRIEGRKLVAREARYAEQCDLATCTTRAELDTLRSLGAARRCDWFPNGVDSSYFAPPVEDYDSNLLCFVGRMDYFPNQQAVADFCRDVWPVVRARAPNLRLAIVGAAPSPAVRALADGHSIEVTGTVPDVRPIVARAAATIAPLKIARGTQNKILESLAMGVPVVSSSLAAGGVDAIPGEHLLVADTPSEWADAVIRLTTDRTLRSALSIAGRARVVQQHSWSASMRRLDVLIDETVRSTRGSAP